MAPAPRTAAWPDYRTVWRWHFYAGLFCIPFVLWLAVTGAVYLFKPQFEAWQDRAYAHLDVSGVPAAPSAQVAAALAAIPGSRLHAYQLADARDSATQVLAGRGDQEYRVYVHPQTLQILRVRNEDARLMKVIARLHGELMLGDRGSMIVETAASWAIIMILSGLALWWPRDGRGLAGLVYPRMNLGGRAFLRDLHAVTGLWISALALCFLLSGLPWAKSWGGNLRWLRQVIAEKALTQDWSTGRASELAGRRALNQSPGHDHHASADAQAEAPALSPLDRLVPVVAAERLPSPVLIAPPSRASPDWTARSDTQNRPQRVNLVLDGASGAILQRKDFASRPLMDRVIGNGIALHEGQRFGWINQLLNLITALGLLTLALSGLLMWWRRRPEGALGAPARDDTRGHRLIWPVAVALGALLPMFGITLLATLMLEKLLLRRIRAVSHFLGLQQPAQP